MKKFSLLLQGILVLVFLLSSCRKQVSDDQITKSQIRDRVQQAQVVQNLSEQQLVEEFNKKEPSYKERVINLIFEALDNEIIVRMFEKPKAQEAIKIFLSQENTLLNILKNLDADELKKLIENPEVQALFSQHMPRPTPDQLGKIIQGLTQEELAQTVALPTVQQAINGEVYKMILRNNQEANVIMENGNRLLKDLKISFQRTAGLDKPLRPNSSDLFLKYELSSKLKKFSCDQVEEANVYWDKLLRFMSQKQKLLGLGVNFFEHGIKSCLFFERLKKSMQTCSSPYIENVNALCKNTLP